MMDARVTEEERIFSANMTAARKAFGWGQLDVAAFADVDQKTVCNIENLKNAPSLRTMSKIAQAFGLSVIDMLKPVGKSNDKKS